MGCHICQLHRRGVHLRVHGLQEEGAPLIYLGLLTLQACFFVLVLALDRVAEWSTQAGVLLVIALTWRISMVREPSQG